jgi:membrane-bound metal-dependent hydrolase YbcI (DUF457 family)
MMGATHAISGAALWLAVTPAVDLVHRQTAAEVVFYALACAGAAMVPDTDHPSSSIAYTFGWQSRLLWGGPTRLLCRFVAWAAGGHRWGTHTLLFAVLAGAVVHLCVLLGWTTVPAVLALGFGIAGFGIFGRGWLSSVFTFAFCLAVVGLADGYGVDWGWLGAVYALGCLAHCLGDWCTPEGVPWFHPFTRTRYSLEVARTSGFREMLLATVMMTVVLSLGTWRLGLWPAVEHVLTVVNL